MQLRSKKREAAWIQGDDDVHLRLAAHRINRSDGERQADQPSLVPGACVAQVLIPELRPNDVIVADNLGCHNAPAVAATIRAAGAIPLYSSDVNPMSNAFAKLKALLRNDANRSIQALWTTIGSLIAPSGSQSAAISSNVPIRSSLIRWPPRIHGMKFLKSSHHDL